MIDLPLMYPLDQLLLMYYLSKRKGLLVHAAGMVLGGRVYLFAGVSGAGKSTISELLVRARIGKVLSDERMIVREIRGRSRPSARRGRARRASPARAARRWWGSFS